MPTSEPYPSNDPIERLLHQAATLWVAEHGTLGPADSYSTSANEFLWAAEHAWFAAGEPPAPPAEPPRAGCHLYRLWATDGRLVYVGVSTRLRDRLRSHRRRWPDLWSHATWEEHPDEAAMLAAEASAIRDEDPALNRAGVG